MGLKEQTWLCMNLCTNFYDKCRRKNCKDTRSRNRIKNFSAEFVKKFKNKQVTDDNHHIRQLN